MKKSSLVFEISWKLSLLVVLGMTLSAFLSINSVKKDVRATFIESQKERLERVDTALTFKSNSNMQQIRSYTMLDAIGRTSTDPLEIQEMLINNAPYRQKNYKNVAYIDYDSGLAYFDDGRVENVSSQEYFQVMKNSNLSQYYAEPIGKTEETVLFPVCKATEPKKSDGKTYVGCFVGFVPLSYFYDGISHDEAGFNSENGFTLALSKDGDILLSPQNQYIMTKKIRAIARNRTFRRGCGK